jgi:hypothetical protein
VEYICSQYHLSGTSCSEKNQLNPCLLLPNLHVSYADKQARLKYACGVKTLITQWTSLLSKSVATPLQLPCNERSGCGLRTAPNRYLCTCRLIRHCRRVGQPMNLGGSTLPGDGRCHDVAQHGISQGRSIQPAIL